MKLVIGGAFQGKLDFAKKMTGKETGCLFFHNNYSLSYNSLKIKEILQSYYKKIIPNSEDNFKLI